MLSSNIWSVSCGYPESMSGFPQHELSFMFIQNSHAGSFHFSTKGLKTVKTKTLLLYFFFNFTIRCWNHSDLRSICLVCNCFVWILYFISNASTVTDPEKWREVEKEKEQEYIFRVQKAPRLRTNSQCVFLSAWTVTYQSGVPLETWTYFALNMDLCMYPDQSYRDGQQAFQPTTLQTLTR